MRLMADQYDIIRNRLPDAGRDFVRAVVNADSGPAQDIQQKMKNKKNYCVAEEEIC